MWGTEEGIWTTGAYTINHNNLTLVYNRLLTLFLVLNLTFSFTFLTLIISVF